MESLRAPHLRHWVYELMSRSDNRYLEDLVEDEKLVRELCSGVDSQGSFEASSLNVMQHVGGAMHLKKR